MPGPGRAKRGAKTSRSAPRPTVTSQSRESFLRELEQESSWTVVIAKLCNHLNLPDLNKRSGLRRVHANFDTIYRKLDNEYNNNVNHPKIPCGIVGIYAKMCTDSLLMKKLFSKDLVSKISWLLDNPDLRHVILVALSTITRHGGTQVRQEIIILTPKLVKLMEDFPDDPFTIDPAVATLSHSLDALIEDKNIPDKALAKKIPMLAVLQVIMKLFRNPTTSCIALDHGFGILTTAALHYSKECKKVPGLVNLLVAMLRSQDWAMRGGALRALLRLHIIEGEEEIRGVDPMKLVANASKGMPPHLSRVLSDYGPERSDITIVIKSVVGGQKLMVKVAQDKDLYSLGLALAEQILLTEWSVPQGAWQAVDKQTGETKFWQIDGLPFTWWQDCLPHCAKAIRDKGKPEEADLADIVDMKFLILTAKHLQAAEIARESLKRSQHAYFYYALAMIADSAEGLRAAKKGLKCKKTSPFIHYQLMQRAVEYACDKGLFSMATTHAPGDKTWEEGVAFLMSAYNDAKTYLDEAPPDTRHMKTVAYWAILLTLAIEGPKLDVNLSKIDTIVRKLELADQFTEFFGHKPPNTYTRMAQNTARTHYKQAAKEWGDLIKRYDEVVLERHEGGHHHDHSGDLDLQGWLDEIQDENGQIEVITSCSHPRVSASSVELYQCSWCKNPSAVLKKCSGCSKARYCDATCQKSHWSAHKAVCKAS